MRKKREKKKKKTAPAIIKVHLSALMEPSLTTNEALLHCERVKVVLNRPGESGNKDEPLVVFTVRTYVGQRD